MTALVTLTALLFLAAALAQVPNRLPRPVRATAIVVAPLAAFLILQAVQAYRGQPIDGRPPAGATYLGSDVREPDWIALLVEVNGEPRLYRVPYTEQLHGGVVNADAGLRRGVRSVIGRQHGRRTVVKRYVLPPGSLPPKNG